MLTTVPQQQDIDWNYDNQDSIITRIASDDDQCRHLTLFLRNIKPTIPFIMEL